MAIESKDLRIGNLVLDPYGNEREVTGVSGNLVYLNAITPGPVDNLGTRIYPASELFPIPINQTRLEKYGFIKDGATDSLWWLNLMDNYFELLYASGDWYPVYANIPEMSHQSEQRVSTSCIRGFHQLQNLYFALTGTELEIAGK